MSLAWNSLFLIRQQNTPIVKVTK